MEEGAKGWVATEVAGDQSKAEKGAGKVEVARAVVRLEAGMGPAKVAETEQEAKVVVMARAVRKVGVRVVARARREVAAKGEVVMAAEMVGAKLHQLAEAKVEVETEAEMVEVETVAEMVGAKLHQPQRPEAVRAAVERAAAVVR